MLAQGHGAGASVTPVAACKPRTKGRSDAADRACRRHRTHPVATWYGACSRRQPQAGCHPQLGGTMCIRLVRLLRKCLEQAVPMRRLPHSPASSLTVIWPSAPSRSRCAAIRRFAHAGGHKSPAERLFGTAEDPNKADRSAAAPPTENVCQYLRCKKKLWFYSFR